MRNVSLDFEKLPSEETGEAKPRRILGNPRKMHSPSDASIRNSSAHIYRYVHTYGNMYLTRYGNELGGCARIPATSSASVICFSPRPSYPPHGFRRASCHRIIVADSASLVPLNPDTRILSQNRSRTPRRFLSWPRITRISGRTVAPDLRAGLLVFSSPWRTRCNVKVPRDFELGTLISCSFSREELGYHSWQLWNLADYVTRSGEREKRFSLELEIYFSKLITAALLLFAHLYLISSTCFSKSFLIR